jgi:hypothetical protein
MEYRRGMWVRIPRQPAWGEGEVVGVEHDKVRILFSEVGEKRLVTWMVEAEEVPARRMSPAPDQNCTPSATLTW